MKTIITQMIDGYNIITGFDQPVIDPEATKVEAGKKDITEQAKKVEKKANEINAIYKVVNDLITQYEQHKKNGDINKAAKVDYEIQLKNIQIEILNDEMKVLLKEKKIADKKIWNESIVYFEPRQGEICITDELASELGKKIIDNPGCKVDVDGNLIVNKIGVKYIKDGKILKVEKLGEEPDGLLMSEVTPDQFEVMRIEAMTEQEKINEVNSIKKSLASQAANMRSTLEIQGDDNALQKARNWYDVEVLNLKEKYGIE